MLCWWALISCVVILGTGQLVPDLGGSSFAAVVAAAVAAAECAACGGLDVEASVAVGPDVMGLAELGTEQGAGKEAVRSERRAEVVPGQTVGERFVLVAVVVADEPAPAATAWTAGADGFAGTAVNITVLDSKALWPQVLHRPPAASGEAGKTASPGV